MTTSAATVLAGRLACTWFLVTGIGQVWLWPLYLWLLWSARSAWLTAAFVAYVAYTTVGPGARTSSSANWPKPLRRWFVWRAMAAYFPARLVKTADLDPEGHYMFIGHPHGVLPMSLWLTFGTEATGFAKAFPGVQPHAATLESNFRVPLLREYIMMHGMCGAGREALRTILTGRPGHSVVLSVGGAAEALLSSPGTYDLVLRSRKGFAKLALQTGASLVPVLLYGETSALRTYIPPPSSHLARFMRAVKATFGFTTPICWGVGLFGGPGLLPLQVPLVTVVGAPIPVERIPLPTEEHVEALHARYVEALQGLWRDTVDKYGKDVVRGLTIVA